MVNVSGFALLPPVAFLYNPTTGLYETLRTPTTYKNALGQATGNTALWTPTAGKKFRILGFTIFVPVGAVNGAADNLVTLKDGATTIYDLFFIAAANTTSVITQFTVYLPGNGFLSSAVNNVLNINCSSANGFTTYGLYVTVWGTEE